MNIKQVLVTSSMLVMAFGWMPTQVMAVGKVVRPIKQELKMEKKEMKEEIKTMRKEWGQAIMNGKIEGISGSVLTVSKEGKTYTINTDDKTLYTRKFGGKASLGEFTTGDMVNVRGSFTDQAKTTVLAKYIRDISIQKRWGSFEGTVKSGSNLSWVVTTKNRGDLNVTLDANTKLTDRKGKTITGAEVVVGNKVVVSGVWNTVGNTLTQVTKLRDISLPVRN